MGSEERRKLFAQFLAGHPDLAPRGAVEIGYLLHDFLETAVVDAGTSVDTGAGFGSFDLWAQVGGEEFYINVKKSGNQLAKDSFHAG